jgi:hypothetical protein
MLPWNIFLENDKFWTFFLLQSGGKAHRDHIPNLWSIWKNLSPYVSWDENSSSLPLSISKKYWRKNLEEREEPPLIPHEAQSN